MNTAVYCATRLTVDFLADEPIENTSAFNVTIHNLEDVDGNEIEVEEQHEITPGDLSAASRRRLIEAEEGDAISVEIGVDWLQENDLL